LVSNSENSTCEHVSFPKPVLSAGGTNDASVVAHSVDIAYQNKNTKCPARF